MRQAQINVRTRACSRTSIARTKQAALTHNVRGKELRLIAAGIQAQCFTSMPAIHELKYNSTTISTPNIHIKSIKRLRSELHMIT